VDDEFHLHEGVDGNIQQVASLPDMFGCTHWKAPPFHGARQKRTLKSLALTKRKPRDIARGFAISELALLYCGPNR
jgi:hypothetical protein